jgi:hypothetical protein
MRSSDCSATAATRRFVSCRSRESASSAWGWAIRAAPAPPPGEPPRRGRGQPAPVAGARWAAPWRRARAPSLAAGPDRGCRAGARGRARSPDRAVPQGLDDGQAGLGRLLVEDAGEEGDHRGVSQLAQRADSLGPSGRIPIDLVGQQLSHPAAADATEDYRPPTGAPPDRGPAAGLERLHQVHVRLPGHRSAAAWRTGGDWSERQAMMKGCWAGWGFARMMASNVRRAEESVSFCCLSRDAVTASTSMRQSAATAVSRTSVRCPPARRLWPEWRHRGPGA